MVTYVVRFADCTSAIFPYQSPITPLMAVELLRPLDRAPARDTSVPVMFCYLILTCAAILFKAVARRAYQLGWIRGR